MHFISVNIYRRITRSLADAMIVNQVDLVVIEGMGRVIHTNLHAKFKCDVLKVGFLISIFCVSGNSMFWFALGGSD